MLFIKKLSKKNGEKQMNKYIEMFALIFGLCSSAILTFFLIKWDVPFYFTESIAWVRIPEIIMGVFALYVLLSMIRKKTIEIAKGSKSER